MADFDTPEDKPLDEVPAMEPLEDDEPSDDEQG